MVDWVVKSRIHMCVLSTFVHRRVFEHVLVSIILIRITRVSNVLCLQIYYFLPIYFIISVCYLIINSYLPNFIILYDVVTTWNFCSSTHFFSQCFLVCNVLR